MVTGQHGNKFRIILGVVNDNDDFRSERMKRFTAMLPKSLFFQFGVPPGGGEYWRRRHPEWDCVGRVTGWGEKRGEQRRTKSEGSGTSSAPSRWVVGLSCAWVRYVLQVRLRPGPLSSDRPRQQDLRALGVRRALMDAGGQVAYRVRRAAAMPI